MRGCFVGSGSEGLQQNEVASTIIRLTEKVPSDITVLYIGTATYDLEQPKINQTKLLAAAGCTITQLKCTNSGDCTAEEMKSKVTAADVIVISGGNTLYAIDRWQSIGLASLLREAAARDCVLAGGSAGAIWIFDAGHSDSPDPETYKDAMLNPEAVAKSLAEKVKAQVAEKAKAKAEGKNETQTDAEKEEEKAAPEPRPFEGKFTDPKHPQGTRELTATSATTAVIKLQDGPQEPILELNAIVQESATGLGPHVTLTVDFSPKGGPKDILAKFVRSTSLGSGTEAQTIAAQLTFPDGNTWSMVEPAHGPSTAAKKEEPKKETNKAKTDAQNKGKTNSGEKKDEASEFDGVAKAWDYMRCPCLGFVPGFCCPHHDKVQSNGILRATDFDKMLLRHPGERGICIDHFAALVIEKDGSYNVLSLPGRPGESCMILVSHT